MAKPVILQVCAVDFTARHFLLPLMRAQREAGFEVELACAPGSDTPAIAAEGFRVFPIPFRRSMNLVAHAHAAIRLSALLRRRRVTVLHAHTPIAALIARPVARRAGVPLVVYTAHGFYFHEGMRPQVRAMHIQLERGAQRSADYLFTQSAEDAQTAIDVGISPADRTLAIGNGVNTSKFDPALHPPQALAELRRELGLEDAEGPVIVMIGRLVREKGYFELLQALARVRREYPGVRALLVGDALPSDHDNQAEKIRAEARHLGLLHDPPAVIFAGLRRDVSRLLALGDIFCLPSWREGMPRSLIEAMAAGLPAVATNIRGCREEVVDGRTGLLVPVRDPEALAAALRRLVADAGLRRSMGEAGRKRAQSHFDEAQVIERQMKVLRRLFEARGLDWPDGEAPQGK